MAEVSVTVNGRSYRITCDDGQEDRVTRLAGYIDQRVSELAGSLGQAGDSTLMLMAGLLIADELSDAYEALEKARARLAEGGSEAAEKRLAEILDGIAARVENLAARLENP